MIVVPKDGFGYSRNFTRDGASKRGPVVIWSTLAGTAIGRGWGTIGHRAGIYGNRVAIDIATNHGTPDSAELREI